MRSGRRCRTVQPGDRVLMSCISSCGRCRFCREGRYGQCQGGGGWVLGHLIDGVQAESVRIPFADGSVHFLSAEIGIRVFARLVTRAGGEVVSGGDF